MSEAYFIKQKKKDCYTILDKTCILDPRLSWKAKGLHTYLMSLPDDWKIYLSEIVKHSTDGIDSLKSAIKQLEKLGYIQKVRNRREDGCFGGFSYFVYEKPSEVPPEDPIQPQRENPLVEKPEMDNPQMEKPSTENPPLLNTNKLINYKKKTELTDCENGLGIGRAAKQNGGPTARCLEPNGGTLKSPTAKPEAPDSFIDLVKSIFDGEYPFDKNFENEIQNKFSKREMELNLLAPYLKYVFERTKNCKPAKSFEGLYRTLALSNSVMRDFKLIYSADSKNELTEKKRKIVYAHCPACDTDFDEMKYYCPCCQLPLEAIRKNDSDEIKIHRAISKMTEEEREKHYELLLEKTKSTGRYFLTVDEKLEFYRELKIL